MNIRYKLSILNKWFKMMSGKSTLHVEQGPGKVYNKEKIHGYYNDLTLKVKSTINYDKEGIPINIRADGEKVYFPIAIFQYALACYDLYLLTENKCYKEEFLNISEWALKKQDVLGEWDTFGVIGQSNVKKQSSMAQAEGASVLARAYTLTNDYRFYENAIKAIDFMLLDIDSGGTTRYKNNNVFFEEFVSEASPTVLNGWIFSIFGLYDIYLLTNEEKYKHILDKSLNTLKENLKKYDCSYWSYYDMNKKMASPFYHNLHIAMLKVLYDLFGIDEFRIYEKKWKKYTRSKVNFYRAFIKKSLQKIRDTNESTIVG